MDIGIAKREHQPHRQDVNAARDIVNAVKLRIFNRLRKNHTITTQQKTFKKKQTVFVSITRRNV